MYLPFLILIIGFFLSFFLTPWLTHRKMTKNDKYPIYKGNYKNFKFCFEKIKNWEYNENYSTSLFCYDKYKCSSLYKTFYIIGEIHANCFIFDDHNMLLGLIDYYRACLLVRKKIKEIKKN